MADFLITQGADLTLENKEGCNALDVAITRIAYKTSLFLVKKGMKPKPIEFYDGKLTLLFDLELFLQKLQNEEEVDSYKIFYERIEREEKEWLNQDLVVDTRESWKVREEVMVV